jgi:hypothetical protein
MPIPISKGRPPSAPACHRARVRTNTMHGTASTGPRLTSAQPHTMPSLSHLACIRPTSWYAHVMLQICKSMQALLALIACDGHAHRVHRSHGSHVIRFSHSRAWVNMDACAHQHLEQLLALEHPFLSLCVTFSHQRKISAACTYVCQRGHTTMRNPLQCAVRMNAHITLNTHVHALMTAAACKGMSD